jgi:hypothetical protein
MKVDIGNGWRGYVDGRYFDKWGERSQMMCAVEKDMEDQSDLQIMFLTKARTFKVTMSSSRWLSLNNIPNADGDHQGRITVSFSSEKPSSSWSQIMRVRRAFSENPKAGFFESFDFDTGLRFVDIIAKGRTLFVRGADRPIGTYDLIGSSKVRDFFNACIRETSYDSGEDPFAK